MVEDPEEDREGTPELESGLQSIVWSMAYQRLVHRQSQVKPY